MKKIFPSNFNRRIAAKYGVELDPIEIDSGFRSQLDPHTPSVTEISQQLEILRALEKSLWNLGNEEEAEKITREIGVLSRKQAQIYNSAPSQHDINLVNNAIKAAQYSIAQAALLIAHKNS